MHDAARRRRALGAGERACQAHAVVHAPVEVLVEGRGGVEHGAHRRVPRTVNWSVGGGEYIGLSNLATDTSGGTTVQGEWIVIDLHTKRKLSGYTLTRKTDSFVGDPKQWKIYGKKSSTANWELIDEKRFGDKLRWKKSESE